MLTTVGPASYLSSMLPKNAAREAPSVRLLQSILQRANVSMEVVGLGSCVLDCLSSRFVRRWREEYCAEEGWVERCEVLAVAALSIALKFLEDTVGVPSATPLCRFARANFGGVSPFLPGCGLEIFVEIGSRHECSALPSG
jgi:hypothetical protein